MKNASLRKNIYSILIIISLGLIAGRILSVENVSFQELQKWRKQQISKILQEKEKEFRAREIPSGTDLAAREARFAKTQQKRQENLERDATLLFPFFSSNDRSRWCTIRALVEPEMRVPGAPYSIDLVHLEKGYNTIDMVKHNDHLYSSKPPLFPTMIAGIYWLIYHLGFSMAEHPFEVARAILLITNIPMMLIFLLSITALAERLGKSDWDRIFIVAAACFTTYMTTFCITLNNHLPAVMSVSITLYLAIKIIMDRQFKWSSVFLIGLFGTFATVNELPALSFLVAILFAVILYLPWKESFAKSLGLCGTMLAGTAIITSAFFYTNYLAHGTFSPPYAKRHKTDPENSWYFYQYTDHQGKLRDSYWQNPQGMDRGEPSCVTYAFHCLFGHHGIFSLTPIWLLAFPGLYIWSLYGLTAEEDQKLRIQLFSLMIFTLTVIICVFYIFRPLHDRNYGGNTSGLRWCFWLMPLWLCAMLPTLEKMEKYFILRSLALILLFFSAISVAYPSWNPWVHPWIFTILGY
ncbi:MAG: hypothetical protein Q4C96_07110 [Planctomycetia bacterium]|nr:hypothetical protein [Planctomycetia bacterium]